MTNEARGAIGQAHGSEWVCAGCHKTFRKLWTDDEALGEMERVFPGGIPEGERVEVCDECYHAMLDHAEANDYAIHDPSARPASSPTPSKGD